MHIQEGFFFQYKLSSGLTSEKLSIESVLGEKKEINLQSFLKSSTLLALNTQ